MQKSYQANAPRNDQMNEQTTHEQKGDQLTRYWRNGGLSASIEHFYKVKHSFFD